MSEQVSPGAAAPGVTPGHRPARHDVPGWLTIAATVAAAAALVWVAVGGVS